MKVIFAAVVLSFSAAQAAVAGPALSALSSQAVKLEIAAPAPVSAPALEQDRKPDTATIEVDAAAMKDKASLMREFVTKMKLAEPVDNWDALIEYLSDMPDTLHVKKVVYLVKHAPALQKNSPALYDDLLGAMQDAADRTKEWSKGKARLEFYLLP